MSANTPETPITAKPQMPVIIGSFVTGVAAMVLIGVLAPTIAAAGSAQQVVLEQRAPEEFASGPLALTEVTEAQRAEIDARLAEAERALSAARASTDAAVARLNRL